MKEYFLALFNGFLSFSSPCVLPLIPGYLSLISGFSAKEILDGKDVNRRKLFVFSLFFVFGFSVIFSLLGAFSSFAGSFIIRNRVIFEKISGFIIFILGLHICGIFKVSFFEYEKRKIFKAIAPNYFTAFITGMSFAFGWSPCIGPFLATILTVAANRSIFEGITLLLVYSIGMGVPFLIVSIFGSFLLKWISSKKLFVIWLERVAGILIASVGILIFFGKFSLD